MEYTVVTTPRGHRSLRKLQKPVKKHLLKKIQILRTDPRSGEQLRKELSFLWALHTTHAGTQYRVAYEINDKGHEVAIHFAGTRENFYKELRRGAKSLLR